MYIAIWSTPTQHVVLRQIGSAPNSNAYHTHLDFPIRAIYHFYHTHHIHNLDGVNKSQWGEVNLNSAGYENVAWRF